MEALILAAGPGRRFDGGADGVPKCLVTIGGKPLIQLQVEALSNIGVDRVCVVVGCGADLVRSVLPPCCTTVLNSRFAETNSLFSLWLARRSMTAPFLLLNGDVLAHPQLYSLIVAAPGSALLYDSSSGQEEEHMKVAVSDGRLEAISKHLSPERVSGENVGILRFEAGMSELVFSAADQLIAQGGDQCWAPAAVDAIAGSTHIRCVDVAGLPWIEIDFPCDLDRARQHVWPAICARRAPGTSPAPSLDGATVLRQMSEG